MPKLLAKIAGAVGLLTAAVLPASAATMSFADFSSTAGLALNGNAAPATDGLGRTVLRVTPAHLLSGRLGL